MGRRLDVLYEAAWRLAEMHYHRLALLLQLLTALKMCTANLFAVVLFELGITAPTLAPYVVIVSSVLQITLAGVSLVYRNIRSPVPNGTECQALYERTSDGTKLIFEWALTNAGSWRLNAAVAALCAALVAGQAVVRARQARCRRRGQLPASPPGVLFAEAAQPAQTDGSLADAVKLALNHLFYKLGLELSLAVVALNALSRMDLIGALYMLALLPLPLVRRSMAKLLWPFFVFMVGLLLFLQYAFLLGLPVEACYDYPWSQLTDNPPAFNDNLIDFIGLPNMNRKFRGAFFRKILQDAVMMIFMSAQAHAFESTRPDHPMGDNSAAPDEVISLSNAIDLNSDFISHKKNAVDYVKSMSCMSSHWLSLSFFLLAGLGGRSLFNIGYLMLAFYMFWQGNGLYRLGAMSKSCFQWKMLLFYNIMVMLLKILFQILACGFGNTVDEFCQVRQLMNIVCLSEESYARLESWRRDVGRTDECNLRDSVEMPLDVIAFLFIVLHIRLIRSKLFQWCVLELRCEEIQANSGAILISKLITKEVRVQFEKQVRILKNIKIRSTKLRMDYERDNEKHSVCGFHPETYHQAKLSADFYMFDKDPQELDLQMDDETSLLYSGYNTDDMRKLNPVQIIYALVAQDFDMTVTLQAVEYAELIRDEEMRMVEAVSKRKPDDTEEDHLASLRARRRAIRDEAMNSNDEAIPNKGFYDRVLVPLGKFVSKLCSATLHYVTCFLRRHSRQHRYVNYVLAKEKIAMKEKILTDLRQTGTYICPVSSVVNIQDVYEIERCVRAEENRLTEWGRFFLAVCNYVFANTDAVCFFWAIVAHAFCGGLITMPLPFLVLFWGALSNPRAEKTFWVCMMIYTQMVIVVKCVSQIVSFYREDTLKLFYRRISMGEVRSFLGIQQGSAFAVFDIILLLIMFLHRYMLQRMGLWRNEWPKVLQRADSEDETLNCFCQFYANVIHPKTRFLGDVYAYTFFLDFICLVIVSLWYSNFFVAASDEIMIIHNNRVPLGLVVSILVFITLIIIDRALYLRKCVMLKLVYHIFTTFVLHIWLFCIVPYLTGTSFDDNRIAQALYIIKCCSLLLSCWQIKNGYPPLCTGNMLTRSYGMLNYLLYKGFMAIPFAFELRVVIDWIWTDTAMPLFDFIRVEFYFATIYFVKCSRVIEQNFPTPRGQGRSKPSKYLLGSPLVFLILGLIVAPIVFVALLNKIGESYKPIEMRASLSIEQFPPIYETTITEFSELRPNDRVLLNNRYVNLENSDLPNGRRARSAVAFLREFENTDIYKVSLPDFSDARWRISTKALYVLHEGLLHHDNFSLRLHIQITRGPSVYDQSRVEKHEFDHVAHADPAAVLRLRQMLQDVVHHRENRLAVRVDRILPYFLVASAQTKLDVPTEMLRALTLVQPDNMTDEWFVDTFGSVDLSLSPDINSKDVYWLAKFKQADVMSNVTLPTESMNKQVDLIFFLERMPPSWLSSFFNPSIVTMYVAFIPVVFRFIRSLILTQPLTVIINEMPNPDPVLRIFIDLYVVREAQDYLMEEDLYAKLIFMFRSPSTLIKWSRFRIKHDE